MATLRRCIGNSRLQLGGGNNPLYTLVKIAIRIDKKGCWQYPDIPKGGDKLTTVANNKVAYPKIIDKRADTLDLRHLKINAPYHSG